MQICQAREHASTQTRKAREHATRQARDLADSFFSAKKTQGFSSDRKISILLLSVLFHLQNQVLVFSQHI